jgi:hypothetical protein
MPTLNNGIEAIVVVLLIRCTLITPTADKGIIGGFLLDLHIAIGCHDIYTPSYPTK